MAAAKSAGARMASRGIGLCVFTTGLAHGAILPLAGGVPVVGLGVSPGLRNFFSTMNIGRYCYEAGSSAQLADWLALVDLGVVATDQKRALSHSAVWKVRVDVRARIAFLAAARAAR